MRNDKDSKKKGASNPSSVVVANDKTPASLPLDAEQNKATTNKTETKKTSTGVNKKRIFAGLAAAAGAAVVGVGIYGLTKSAKNTNSNSPSPAPIPNTNTTGNISDIPKAYMPSLRPTTLNPTTKNPVTKGPVSAKPSANPTKNPFKAPTASPFADIDTDISGVYSCTNGQVTRDRSASYNSLGFMPLDQGADFFERIVKRSGANAGSIKINTYVNMDMTDPNNPNTETREQKERTYKAALASFDGKNLTMAADFEYVTRFDTSTSFISYAKSMPKNSGWGPFYVRNFMSATVLKYDPTLSYPNGKYPNIIKSGADYFYSVEGLGNIKLMPVPNTASLKKLMGANSTEIQCSIDPTWVKDIGTGAPWNIEAVQASIYSHQYYTDSFIPDKFYGIYKTICEQKRAVDPKFNYVIDTSTLLGAKLGRRALQEQKPTKLEAKIASNKHWIEMRKDPEPKVQKSKSKKR